ncbi:Acetyltransferase (GNAT) domain-containing protein [Alkalibacterium subtropicum]|uniref:Acetyltransferase (GNAT) domain-containing protein n=1 Tax=Alkalibacterium subtropicum TaxID=753702 RepID=A0A1I1GQJ0_9LACT|nr:GNAT family N-acetyltransferase [Alkalibacterium subtropicum]SFC12148.1 Acetyltransferase (GNAT) domain-containing protein [Alkalibacterium subtropicum]
MDVTPIAHLENKDIRRMKRLNKEAFPTKERIAFTKLLALSRSLTFDFLAVKEGETFIGFYLIAKNPGSAYIFFFAVTEKQSSKGYGRQLLNAIKDYYPHQQIVLDLEEMAQTDPLEAHREKKKEFYEENGFHETGYDLAYGGKKYELLCSKNAFDKESFKTLLTDIKPIINRIKPERFEPDIIAKTAE